MKFLAALLFTLLALVTPAYAVGLRSTSPISRRLRAAVTPILRSARRRTSMGPMSRYGGNTLGQAKGLPRLLSVACPPE